MVHRVPNRGPPDVQGDPAQPVPETGIAAVERAGHRLDAVPPQQAQVVAARAGAQRRHRLAAGAGHQAPQAGVLGELPQQRPGHAGSPGAQISCTASTSVRSARIDSATVA